MNFTKDSELDKVEEVISTSSQVAAGVKGVVITEAAVCAALGVSTLSSVPILLGGPVVWAVAGIAWLWHRKRKQDRLRQRKEALLQEAIRARDAVIAELKSSVNKAQDRIDQLTTANKALQVAVEKLSADLK